ncbi:hypothetical protein E1A91_D12G269600v1 [Gossypium mustelinum]|uniref:Uncharacterized protein n=1 Tax=Gossypium mustelinum TaxID=34275 RepID=A0A5D2SJI2_GOSMU|nr:hypothetical protein E1A91_D12G269600v1 [Gossypium mustelinum]
MKPTRESMVTNRRQLTPAQRSAKIERDRRRRRERNMEFERLQKAEAELQALTAAQRNENSCLRHHNERLNDMVSILENIIHQLREQNRELQQKNLGLEQTMKLADSWFPFDKCQSPNEEVSNNQPSTEGPRSSQSRIPYAQRISDLLIDQHTSDAKHA